MSSFLLLEDGSSYLLAEDGSSFLILEEVGPGPPSSPAAGRVLIAPGGNPLDPEPAWEAFDMLSNCRCSGFEITTGRQSEFDKTDTGTASVFFHDRARVLDDPELVGSPILLQVQDPTTGTWQQQYRGTIDEPDYQLEPSWAATSNVNLRCKDLFDYLAGVEFIVGVHGFDPDETQPIPSGGAVFYAMDNVQERIRELLNDAGVDPLMSVIFSGNIRVVPTFYDAGDSLLVGLRDAADAEFPGIANLYIDRYGRINFHGRLARFDPDTTAAEAGNEAWDFNRWEAATREDVGSSRAQIRGFSYNMPKSRIYNAAISWPRWKLAPDNVTLRPFGEKDKANQIALDGTSQIRYGYRAFPPMGDLLVLEGIGEFNGGNTAAEECLSFAQYYVSQYATPRRNLRDVTFRSIRPDDERADATWAIMLRSDISDIVALTVDEAGLAAEDYYIEGFQKTVRALNPDYDDVTVTPNLSPSARYDYDWTA